MINIKGPGNTVNKKAAKELLPKNKKNIPLHSALNLATGRRNHNYAVYNNGNFVGFALLTPNKNTLNLNLIATAKPKHGYGKVLMNKIKANAQASGFKYINLYPVNNAVKFYKKQNFKQVPFSQKFRFEVS